MNSVSLNLELKNYVFGFLENTILAWFAQVNTSKKLKQRKKK
jgi:hypothetical protein